jgi:hypothetical protein
MRKFWLLSLPALFCALLIRSQNDPFVEKPYLQLGDRPKEAATEALTVLWQAASEDAKWQVQIADQGVTGEILQIPRATPSRSGEYRRIACIAPS